MRAYGRGVAAAVATAMLATGCETPQLNQSQSEALTERSRDKLSAPGIRQANVVRVSEKVVVPMVPFKEEARPSWLANKRVRLINDRRRPLNLGEVVKMFFDQGINISSSIPLEGYTYAGLGVHDVDAETALRSILGAVGLDYELDEGSRTVLIRPMASRSWKISIGDRKSSFTSNSGGGQLGGGSTGGDQGQGGQLGGAAGSQGAQAGQGGQGGQGAQLGQGNGDQGGQSSATSGVSGGGNAGGGGGGSTSTNDDFWGTFRTELRDRMEVLLPGVATSASDLNGTSAQPGVIVPAPGPLNMTVLGQPPGPQALAQSADFYVKKRIGIFSLNPVTGNVTVQAPRWLLNDLDKYIKKIIAEYSYRITFVGQMVLVTTTDRRSEGLDISSFGQFAKDRYGVAFSNNALGGVTVNFPGSGIIPAVAAGGQPLAGTLLGIRSPLDGLQIFNAYLQNYGTVNTIQRPIVVTSKGVPGYFSKTSRKYFVKYSQSVAAGNTGSAAVASQNEFIPFDFGTTLSISTDYDVDSDIVRANIILDQVVQAGTQTVPQQVSSGGGTQQVNQEIPLPSTFKYRGGIPLRDGDLIVIGGQSEDEMNSSDGGVPGLKNSPFGAVFGQKNSTKTTGTYYFALRVQLTKSE